MKKITLIISALAFSAVCFAQTTEVEKKAMEREAQIVNGTAVPFEQVNDQIKREEHEVPLKAVDQNSRMTTGTRMDNATEIQSRKLNRDGSQIDDSETVPVNSQTAPVKKVEDSKLQQTAEPVRVIHRNDTPEPRN